MTSPIVSIDTQHEDMIHDAQLDYYTQKLATCSSDHTVKVFSVQGSIYTLQATITGHRGPVWEVSWAHPKFGVLLASCSYDGRVLIYAEDSSSNWATIYEHAFHESSVNSISWAPHEYGLALACASSDGKVSILEYQENSSWKVASLDVCPMGVNSISWAPFTSLGGHVNGKVVKRLVTGSCDNRATIWYFNNENNEWQRDPQNLESKHSDWVRDVAWAPSTGIPCNIIASCSEDKTVLIWTQTEINGPWSSTLLNVFDGPVWRVNWSLTGNVLAVSSGDHTVTLWKQALNGEWEQISANEDGVETKHS